MTKAKKQSHPRLKNIMELKCRPKLVAVGDELAIVLPKCPPGVEPQVFTFHTLMAVINTWEGMRRAAGGRGK